MSGAKNVIAGKYQLKSPLGKGGHGTVYRATHLDLDEDVAIKVLNPEIAQDDEARKRFLREAKLATSFVHKYAVQLRDFGRDATLGCLYLTMDLVEGPTLAELLNKHGPLDEPRAVRLFAQVCEALDEAHRAGIVHRDLKPANLILTKGRDGGEEVRILDFGVAKAVTQAAQDALGMTGLTMGGMRVGTLLYMSPEQAQGMEVDGRSDLYTLGALLYEALTGKKPVLPDKKAANPMQSFLFRLTTVQPRAVRELAPHISQPLDEVVLRALRKGPAERWPTAAALRAALLAVPPVAVTRPSRRLRAKSGKHPTRSQPLTKVEAAAALGDEAPTVREPVREQPRRPETRSRPREVPPTPARGVPLPPKEASKAPAARSGSHEGAAAKAPKLVSPPVARPVTPPRPSAPTSRSIPATSSHQRPPSQGSASSASSASAPRAPAARAPEAEAKPRLVAPKKLASARPAQKAPALLLPKKSGVIVPGLPDGLVPGKRKGEFVNTKDGSVLLWVPPGTFRMGASRGGGGLLAGLLRRGDERQQDGPVHEVTITRGFYLGKVPITWKRWRRFCQKTGRPAPTSVDFKDITELDITDRHPAVNVSWKDAQEYCRWARVRLPTEAEWEYAARGTDERPYPWGSEPVSADRANWEGHPVYGRKATSPAGALAGGASPFGCLDMAGNVWEWVEDYLGDYGPEPQVDPKGPKGAEAKVIRGGCWQSDASQLAATTRFALAPTERRNWLGFRVCRSS